MSKMMGTLLRSEHRQAADLPTSQRSLPNPVLIITYQRNVPESTPMTMYTVPSALSSSDRSVSFDSLRIYISLIKYNG